MNSGPLLEFAFCQRKWASKILKRPYLATFCRRINSLQWSDPDQADQTDQTSALPKRPAPASMP